MQSRDLKSEIKEALQEVVEEQKRSLVLRYNEKYREMELKIQELTVENERMKNWWRFWRR